MLNIDYFQVIVITQEKGLQSEANPIFIKFRAIIHKIKLKKSLFTIYYNML